MVIKISVVLLVTIVALTSCDHLMGENEKLTFTKQRNESNRLKLDGYYSRIDSVDKYLFRSIVFLYKDETMLDLGSYNQFDFKEQLITDPEILEKTKIDIVCWGLYKLSNDSISFEKGYHSGGPPKVTYISKGVVLNDTTFLITSSRPSREERIRYKNDVYHFRKFRPNPDSINNFIR
jgi:hypothetical protein